ncbi:MAG: hypothetical protein ACFFC3_10945 [Candidatus Odinarchaeota archaeon]
MGQKLVLYTFLIYNIFTSQSCSKNGAIDPLDPFCGSYECQVVYVNHLDSEHALFKPDTTYYTTLEVSNYDSNSILQVSGDIFVKIELDLTDSTFKGADFPGQRLEGNFFSDSIYMTTYMTSAALIRWTYTGKRVSQ